MEVDPNEETPEKKERGHSPDFLRACKYPLFHTPDRFFGVGSRDVYLFTKQLNRFWVDISYPMSQCGTSAIQFL